jgi:hypothetical protein
MQNVFSLPFSVVDQKDGKHFENPVSLQNLTQGSDGTIDFPEFLALLGKVSHKLLSTKLVLGRITKLLRNIS